MTIHCWLTLTHLPFIRFLFVHSEFGLQLPLHPASQRRSCLQLVVPVIRAYRGLSPHKNNAMPGTQTVGADLQDQPRGGMSTRDIVQAFQEMYGVDVSPTLISQVTNAVIEEIRAWQARPLDSVYPIVYLDCIVVKIRQDNRIINKSIFLALGVDLDGQKELLGLWLAENEGAKFWLQVLTELQNRGVKQILIACVDGLKGFPDAIAATYPHARIQLCIVHMVRNSLKFVPWKDYRAVTTDLKKIYRSATEPEALAELEQFAEKWDSKYPQISTIWHRHWPNLITIFNYPEDIRKAIYTTNAVESLNSVIRKAIKTKKLFPNDNAAVKLVYLAIKAASKKWTMPIRNWKSALNRFIIEFDEQLKDYI